MMRLVLVLLCVAFAAPLAAQPGTLVTVRLGLDANDVPGLVRWQVRDRDVTTQRGIPVAATDSFPAFVGYQAEATRAVGADLRLGLHVGFGSTSGRLDYADFSGTARIDRRARRLLVGVTSEYLALELGATQTWLGFRARASRVSVAFDRSVVAEGQTFESVESTYGGWTAGIEPGLAVEASVGPAVVVRAEAGIELGLGGSLSSSTPGLASVDRVATSEWGGVRVGLAVGTRF